MKILFLSEAVSLAHFGRPQVLAKWAHENGDEVHFASSAKSLISAQANFYGFKTYPLYTIDENSFYDRVTHGKFFYQPIDLKKYLEAEQSIIMKINPDLIVSDFRLTASISAKLCGIPLLNLSNSYWCPNYACPFPAPDAGIFKHLSQHTTDFIFNMIRPFAFKVFGKELNQTRKLYGFKKKNDFRELYTDGTYTAYMDLPNFIDIKTLPENHFYIGPIIWSPEVNTKNYSLSEKNNVYISMGSSGNNDFILHIINAAFKNNLNIILSGVSLIEKENLIKRIPELSSHSIIEPLIEADNVLPYCKLTICHGGSGTVYQSIAKGIPILCFPKNPDQGLVSMAVAKNNIGRFLTRKSTNLSSIDEMIKLCISNDLISQNAKNMQLEISKWNTKRKWIQFLSKFKTIRKTKKTIA